MQYDGISRMTSQLIKLLDSDTEAAANPALYELLTALMEDKKTAAKYSLQTWNLLPKMPQELVLKFLPAQMRADLAVAISSHSVSQVLDYESIRKLDHSVVASARGQLLPEYQQKFEAAIADPAKTTKALHAMLPYLYCGGSVDAGTLEQLLAKSLPTDHSAMLWWGITSCRQGEIQGLRVLLTCAKLFEDVQKDALSRFESAAGLDVYTAQNLTFSNERLTADQAWFDANEKQFVWDVKLRKFKTPDGVAPPNIHEYQLKPVKPPAPPPEKDAF